jgi:hypothetical protein
LERAGEGAMAGVGYSGAEAGAKIRSSVRSRGRIKSKIKRRCRSRSGTEVETGAVEQ